MALKGEEGPGLQKSTREQVLGIALKAPTKNKRLKRKWDGTVWAVLGKWRWMERRSAGRWRKAGGPGWHTETRKLNPVLPSLLGPSQPVADFGA